MCNPTIGIALDGNACRVFSSCFFWVKVKVGKKKCGFPKFGSGSLGLNDHLPKQMEDLNGLTRNGPKRSFFPSSDQDCLNSNILQHGGYTLPVIQPNRMLMNVGLLEVHTHHAISFNRWVQQIHPESPTMTQSISGASQLLP